MQVSPVARIPDMVPHSVPQILINREPLPHLRFNAELLGSCDEILEELSARLGWNISPRTYTPARACECISFSISAVAFTTSTIATRVTPLAATINHPWPPPFCHDPWPGTTRGHHPFATLVTILGHHPWPPPLAWKARPWQTFGLLWLTTGEFRFDRL